MDQMEALNSKLIVTLDDAYPIGLVGGKMGLCIYFYYLSRWEEKEEYKQIAEKLLDDVVSQLSETMDVTVESGLSGVAMGISHLVKEGFIAGDINEILEDVDSAIFKTLAFLKYKDAKYQIPKADFIYLLCYLHLRYTEQASSDDKYLFQELIVRTIEMFENDLQSDFFNEHSFFSLRNFHLPLFLYIISKIYKLNIYNNRITKILEEHIDQIVTTIPVLHANRLYLLWGLINVKPCLPDYEKEINSHIQLLKEGIDIDRIVNVELKNQDIYLMDGLSFVYLLLFCLQTNSPAYRIDYNPQLFLTKIATSEAWSALQDRAFYFHSHCGLFDGFPGVNLILSHIKRHFS